jgi:hypothetical protein
MVVEVQIYLDLGTKWRRVVRFTFRALYPTGKEPSELTG